ncbi:P-loop NTPase fold protein [Mucilaginibacter xinganensis]|uniref:KAP NTPase domain-containing protein n=1 Tax=Mucilaginibacter xinganensis TaxID=1234841 RepID=A0A223P0B4_9SPHI|nr:P-loop NTPase fold protein [Mucilaginibacter xinganensis]ASU35460.1 hypothetical protein MuYL_3575 [Mucilaginibacter xinganensis]
MKSPDQFPHQQSAVNVITENIKKDVRRLQIAMAPGTGKYQVIAGVIAELQEIFQPYSRKVLVITGSSALQQQLLAQFRADQSDYLVIDDFSILNSDEPSISVCTLQSLHDNKRMRLREMKRKPDVIISLDIGPDQPSLKSFLASYSEAIQIAFVNHPGKSNWFGDPIWAYSVSDAINDQILLPLFIKQISFTDFQKTAENDQFPDDQPHLIQAARIFLTENKDQKAIVYCPSVVFAKRFAEELNQTNKGLAVVIHAGLHMGERRRLISEYQRNPNPVVLCSASVLGDFRELALTKTIAILRNTSSQIELQNMLVPGLLPFADKEQGIVLDFVGLKGLLGSLGINGKEEFEDSVESNVVIESEGKKPGPDKRYFKKADIQFRDKKEIDGVLGVGELADELAEIITMMPAEQGSMIGIFGKWGRGKTFLIDQTWKKLKAGKKFIKVDYHAWKYQDTPATWAYLYECLAEAYFKPDVSYKVIKWLIGIGRVFWLNIRRKGLWPLFKFIGIISAGGIAWLLSKELFSQLNKDLETLLNRLGLSLAICTTAYALFVSAKKEYSAKAKDLFLKYSTKHSFKEHLGIQAEIQKETLTLLKTWIPKRKLKDRKIILFVEDIDRCNEVKTIQIIDSLRVLLEDPKIAERIVVVTAVDERILKLAIKMKYYALVSLDKAEAGKENELRKALNAMVNEYIDKLFIAGLKLGNLSLSESDEFFLALTKPDRIEEKANELTAILTSDNNREYGRYSQQIRDHDFDQMVIDSELANQEDWSYEEPDFAMDVLEGSEPLTESAPIEDTANNAPLNKLSNDEVDILRVSIAKYKGVTPRQIRVFYYRYLIAKNLLIRRYEKMGRTSVWQIHFNCRVLATLIVSYTVHEEAGILEGHLMSSLDNQQQMQSVALMKETVINGFDYQQLLKVLSIVIAY